MTDDALEADLRRQYGAAARRAAGGAAATAPADGCGDRFGAALYERSQLDVLPAEAAAGSIGCANPVALVDLQPGEDVLDLGSGGGIDVLLSARRVAPGGRAYGLDMTAEMLDLARANQRRAGVANAEFLAGRIEDVPLPDRSVDVVLSNCVINLSADKDAVLAEAFRVLRPGGRFAVADVVTDRRPDPRRSDPERSDPERSDRTRSGAWTSCAAGAITREAYRSRLAAAGFVDVDVTDSHQVGDGLWSVLVRARRPAAAP